MKRIMMMGCISVLGFTLAWAGDTSASKESYLKKAENEVQEWTVKLKSLQDRSEKNGVKTRKEFDQDLKAVSDQLAIAQKKLGIAQGSGENSLKNLRRSLDETLRQIKRDYEKAVSFFNKTETKEKKS